MNNFSKCLKGIFLGGICVASCSGCTKGMQPNTGSVEEAGSISPSQPCNGSCATPVSSSVSPGFYVATNGNDSNPGSFSLPFATMAKAQTAVRANQTIKTVYLRSGTYTIDAPISLNSSDNGETWTTYPNDAAQSAILLNGGSNAKIFDIYDVNSVQNITISNLTFDGGTSGGNGAAAIFIDSNGNGIHVQSNLFRNNSNQSDLFTIPTTSTSRATHPAPMNSSQSRVT